MALSRTTGAAAAAIGVLTGLVTVIAALAEPDTLACVQKVASVFGEHGAAIGGSIVGAIAIVAPLVSWFSHPPKAATPDAP